MDQNDPHDVFVKLYIQITNSIVDGAQNMEEARASLERGLGALRIFPERIFPNLQRAREELLRVIDMLMIYAPGIEAAWKTQVPPHYMPLVPQQKYTIKMM